MNRVLIDRQLLERLDCLEVETEFVDQDGRRLGRFIPEREGSPGPRLLPPRVSDPQERARLLAAMIERMKATPLSPDAPRLTRDALHDRD